MLLRQRIALVFLLLAYLLAGVDAAPLNHHSIRVSPLFRRQDASPSNQELLDNTIGFGCIAIFVFILRCLNRGWVLRKFHLEDYLMCITMLFYINLLVLINVSADYATNLYPPEDALRIEHDPVEVKNRIFGSKLVIPLEQSMMASTWGVKLCIWVFLLRLCRQLTKYTFVIWGLFWYIWIGFVVIEIVYYGIFCRPFSQYWAMPVTNQECATYHNYSIVQMVFNISSDLGLFTIPMVMVFRSRLPMKRKAVLGGIFSLAGFTIMAAIMNKYYNFASPQTTIYQLWYIREASIAITISNLICTWQLLQKIFKLRSFDDQNANIVDEPEIKHFLHHRVNDENLNIGVVGRIPLGVDGGGGGRMGLNSLKRLWKGDFSALMESGRSIFGLGTGTGVGRNRVGGPEQGVVVREGENKGFEGMERDVCAGEREWEAARPAIEYRIEHKIE